MQRHRSGAPAGGVFHYTYYTPGYIRTTIVPGAVSGTGPRQGRGLWISAWISDRDLVPLCSAGGGPRGSRLMQNGDRQDWLARQDQQRCCLRASCHAVLPLPRILGIFNGCPWLRCISFQKL